MIVAVELGLDVGVPDGAGEALGLRDVDGRSADHFGEAVEVLRPDRLGDLLVGTLRLLRRSGIQTLSLQT